MATVEERISAIQREIYRQREEKGYEIAQLVADKFKPTATAREIETLAYALEQFLA